MNKDIFISYRRNTGSSLAKNIKNKIENNSLYKCFLDVDNLTTGDYKLEIVKNIKLCTLMIIVITEGYLEKCLNENDICLEEIATAIKFNKEISIITNIDRSRIREILNYENTPSNLKELININMMYADSNLEETIHKIIINMDRININKCEKLNFELCKYNMSRGVKRIPDKIIKIKKEKIIYIGEKIDNKLYGEGYLKTLDNKINICGNFNCYTDFIQGNFNIYKGSSLIFRGVVDEFKYIEDLIFDGNGELKINDDIIASGNIRDGKLYGYIELRSKNNDYFYNGIYKNGIRHGKGTTIINNGNDYLEISTLYIDDIVKGDIFIKDKKKDIEYTILKNNFLQLINYEEIGENNISEEEYLSRYASIYVKLNKLNENLINKGEFSFLYDGLEDLLIEIAMINLDYEDIIIDIVSLEKNLVSINITDDEIVKVVSNQHKENINYLNSIDYKINKYSSDLEIERGYLEIKDKILNPTELDLEESKLIFNGESNKYKVNPENKKEILEIHHNMDYLARLSYRLSKDIVRILKEYVLNNN